MTNRTKYVIGGVVVAGLVWWMLPTWIFLLALAVIIGVPVAGYLMLDPSQRKRLGRVGRKQLNR